MNKELEEQLDKRWEELGEDPCLNSLRQLAMEFGATIAMEWLLKTIEEEKHNDRCSK